MRNDDLARLGFIFLGALVCAATFHGEGLLCYVLGIVFFVSAVTVGGDPSEPKERQ